MEKLEITGLNIETISSINSTLLRREDLLGKLKDKSINKMIDMNIEDMKRERYLTPMIRELDIQELKKLDAVLHRGDMPSNHAYIAPIDLSERAVNLYVAIVKGAFSKTVDSCSRLYSSDELINMAKTYQTLTEELHSANGNKNKKFEVAQRALLALRHSSISKETNDTEKLLVK